MTDHRKALIKLHEKLTFINLNISQKILHNEQFIIKTNNFEMKILKILAGASNISCDFIHLKKRLCIQVSYVYTIIG